MQKMSTRSGEKQKPLDDLIGKKCKLLMEDMKRTLSIKKQ